MSRAIVRAQRRRRRATSAVVSNVNATPSPSPPAMPSRCTIEREASLCLLPPRLLLAAPQTIE
jgi:hypothetical protein